MKRRKNTSLLALTTILVAASTAIVFADVTSITPTDDVLIVDYAPNQNNDRGNLVAGPQGNNRDAIIFIRFPIEEGDIPEIQEGSRIDNVFLTLYRLPNQNNRPNLSINRVNRPAGWREENLVWNDDWSYTGPLEGGAWGEDGDGNRFWRSSVGRRTVRDLVREWYGGDRRNDGFTVAADLDQGNVNNAAGFWDKENADPDELMPSLTIFYEPPEGEPDIRTDPRSLNFGDVNVYEEAYQNLRIINEGESTLTVSDAVLGGQHPDVDYFSLIGWPDLPFNMEPSDYANVTVGFRPRDDGLFDDASLVINSNDPDESHLIIELRGRGVRPGSVDTYDSQIPTNYILYQNFPNPFNSLTNISFSIPHTSYVSLSIYDVSGGIVVRLVEKQLSAGYYTTTWNAKSSKSGIYFVKIEAEEFGAIKKVMLIR